MLVYNVTVKIDPDVHDEWLHWMKTVHIPEVLQSGKFTESRILRILGQEEPDGITYAIQYSCPDMPLFQRYLKENAPALQAGHKARYEGKYVAFRTLMEEVGSMEA